MNRRRDWPVAVVLMACTLGSLLFFGLVKAGEHVRCQQDPHLAYCSEAK